MRNMDNMEPGGTDACCRVNQTACFYHRLKRNSLVSIEWLLMDIHAGKKLGSTLTVALVHSSLLARELWVSLHDFATLAKLSAHAHVPTHI